MKKSSTKYLIASTFLAMFVMAISDSTRGLLIPTFKSEFNVTDTTIGIFLLFGSIAYIAATYFGSILCTKFGQKHTIQLGMAIAGITFLITSYSQNFLQITIGYSIVTVGLAFIIIGMNTIVPLIKVAYLGVVMNMLHFFYGFGATITQKVTGYLIYNGITWRMIFTAYFGLYIFAFIVYSFVKQPHNSEELHLDEKGKVKIHNMKLVILFSLALGFYVTSEVQTSNWMMNFMKEIHSLNTDQGSFYLALFFGLLAFGRLIGGFIIEKIGYIRAVIFSQIAACSLYYIGLFIGMSGLLLISLSGFFFSITYPTLLLVIQKIFTKNSTKVVGIVTMTASSISMITGYIIGSLNDILGTEVSYWIIPSSLAISIILLLIINNDVKKMNNGLSI